jgi:hypothetical protein
MPTKTEFAAHGRSAHGTPRFRAVRQELLEVEENFEKNADQDAVDAAMVKWDEVLASMTEGDGSL